MNERTAAKLSVFTGTVRLGNGQVLSGSVNDRRVAQPITCTNIRIARLSCEPALPDVLPNLTQAIFPISEIAQAKLRYITQEDTRRDAPQVGANVNRTLSTNALWA